MTSWHPKVRSRDLDTDVIMIPLANLFVPGVLVPMSSKRLFGWTSEERCWSEGSAAPRSRLDIQTLLG